MDINHLQEGAITIITINGRLDAAAATVADKTIKKILKGDFYGCFLISVCWTISAVAA